jgi:hypothetical protein
VEGVSGCKPSHNAFVCFVYATSSTMFAHRIHYLCRCFIHGNATLVGNIILESAIWNHKPLCTQHQLTQSSRIILGITIIINPLTFILSYSSTPHLILMRQYNNSLQLASNTESTANTTPAVLADTPNNEPPESRQSYVSRARIPLRQFEKWRAHVLKLPARLPTPTLACSVLAGGRG